MNPPRALWVPFYLGRPFGVPGDADFQRDVLRAALNLLPTATEHTIVDYPIEAPDDSFSDSWACPVSFEATDAGTLSGRLRGEVQRLAPWWQETYRARGRSLMGGSGARPEEIETLVAVLAAVAEGAALDAIPEAGAEISWSYTMPFLVRHIAQDVRSFYTEALAAQPGSGGTPSHRALNDWIFTETVLGEVLLEVGRRLTETDDDRLRILRGWLIPEGYWPDASTWGLSSSGDRLAVADAAFTLFADGD